MTMSSDPKRFIDAAEAIRAYVDTNEWQIAAIQAAIVDADQGDFATDNELDELTRKWG